MTKINKLSNILTLSFNCWHNLSAAPMSNTESLSLGIEQSTCNKKQKENHYKPDKYKEEQFKSDWTGHRKWASTHLPSPLPPSLRGEKQNIESEKVVDIDPTIKLEQQSNNTVIA